MDVHGEIGGVREMIREYIIHVKGGVISPECDNSWRITGNNWDPALHQKAVEMLAAGELSVPDMPEDAATDDYDDAVDFATEDLYGNPVNIADVFAEHEITMVNMWATCSRPPRATPPTARSITRRNPTAM